jgi:hypothetical protein
LLNSKDSSKKTKKFHIKKTLNRIITHKKVIFMNGIAYKGNKKDTNLLNINFKTVILNELSTLK